MAEIRKQANPWAQGTINLTEQARILRESPTLAEELRAAAELQAAAEKPKPNPVVMGGRRSRRKTPWLAGGK